MRFAGWTIFVNNLIDERFLAVWADLAENHEANIPTMSPINLNFVVGITLAVTTGLTFDRDITQV